MPCCLDSTAIFKRRTAPGKSLRAAPKALACNLPKEQDYYSIDWNDGKSLQNWMTDMNLICEPAYRIGLIGSLQFVGLALGAVIFTPFADTYGRKPVLIFSVALTPIVMFSLLIFATNINHLYFWITFLSLSFSSRCSTSFMMGQEYLKKTWLSTSLVLSSYLTV